MTNQEKLDLLREWSVRMKTADILIDPVIEVLSLSPESPICKAVWSMQASYTKAIGQLVGDKAEWLDWYANENDFGRKAYEAGEESDMRPIKSLDDLLWVIGGEA